ncbi:MAG TPA: DUF1345 domain-containing protein [Hanamia sp.]|nr:DUF1345 domain-containing protein [Hanamia sp.]
MEKEVKKSISVPLFERINSLQKFLICIVIAVIVYFIADMKNIGSLSHIMIGWDTFSICMVVMSWITFSIVNSKQIREQSKVQDSSRSFIFIIVVISTLASFLAVLLLIITKKEGDNEVSWQMPIAITGMLFSWILIHTIFTLRYAHIFYGDHETKPNTHAGGLEFPGDSKPEYFDFAYFSFVLGMTFQVSDVQITSKRLRSLAMFHGLISFGFNTIMIALTINLIAGYGG